MQIAAPFQPPFSFEAFLSRNFDEALARVVRPCTDFNETDSEIWIAYKQGSFWRRKLVRPLALRQIDEQLTELSLAIQQGAPAIAAARARYGGLQDFVGMTIGEWAQELGIIDNGVRSFQQYR